MSALHLSQNQQPALSPSSILHSRSATRDKRERERREGRRGEKEEEEEEERKRRRTPLP
jgi:hypothetical protein